MLVYAGLKWARFDQTWTVSAKKWFSAEVCDSARETVRSQSRQVQDEKLDDDKTAETAVEGGKFKAGRSGFGVRA
jgi:hypothetical protein